PGAEGALPGPSERVLASAGDRRGKVEAELEIALELIAKLLLELAVGEQTRDLVFVLVGQQFRVVDRDRARQRLAIAASRGGVTHLVHQLAVAHSQRGVLVVGEK